MQLFPRSRATLNKGIKNKVDSVISVYSGSDKKQSVYVYMEDFCI